MHASSSMFSFPSEAFGHSGRVFGLAFHPIYGNQILASASEDETVRVWRRSDKTCLWEQTSCCRGHTAEVLRVAWSPDGSALASGSADHTVRLWQVGLQDEQSYSGVELAVLSGHPEEVYGLKFLPNPALVSSNGTANNAAGSNMLATASGESLFLWDLHSGKMLHESAALPVVEGMKNLSLGDTQRNSSTSATAQNMAPVAEEQHGAADAVVKAAAASAAVETGVIKQQDRRRQQQQQQQQQAAEEADEVGAMPSYIFGLGQADGTSWLGAACADGMLRLWDAGQGCLQEVAAVKVHPSDMGSCCSFVPGQPWLVLSISKSGQLVLQDVRLLGHPLLLQQLEGPVYDITWTVQAVQHQPSAAAAGGDGSSLTGQLCLCVVGKDHCVRSYGFTQDTLLQGHVQDPVTQPMPGGYAGRLLAVASTADGACIAAAGEAVPADTLKPITVAQRRQMQQVLHPKPQQQQQQQQQQSPVIAAGGAVVAAAAAPAVAAAVSVAAARGRRVRGKGGTGRQTVDLFGMDAEETSGQAPTQQLQQQLHQSPAQAAAAAATEAINSVAESRQGGLGMTVIASSDAEGAAQHGTVGQGIEDVSVQVMPACAAAAAGVLLRAPLFCFNAPS